MHFDPHFDEVRGGVENWWLARWKARAEFLFSVIKLLFLSLAVEALQGKTCQNAQPSGMGSGGNCTVLRAVVLTQYRRVTDRRTDGRKCCS